MTMPDGSTLTGAAAILTSIASLIATLRGTANRPTMPGPAAPARSPRRRTRRAGKMVSPGRQEG